jgi:hydroxymethylpyrimidine kinase/phosphomethylpyrimidine kinase
MDAAAAMRDMGANNVLIKGGHLQNSDRSTDYLFIGDELTLLEAERIQTLATHGTGCTLSSAIAANLALGKSLKDAVQIAKRFVTEAIRSAPNIGHGHSPINQLISVK